MKLLLITFSIYFLSITASAQTWFEVGLKGGPATTFLMNKNFLNDTQFNPKLTPTYFYGAKIGINFGEQNGIAIHAGGTKVQQKFINEYPNAPFDERKFASNLVEIGVLYHRTSNSGYFEVGPRISLVQSGELIDDGGARQDISDELIGTYYGMDLGFGSYVIGGDHLSLMMGLRFSYGITPIDLDERPIAPIQAQYGDSRSVNVFSAMLCIELNYSLGYLVRSTCGRRTSWISF
ncbi:MAG: hypothetical protein COA32_15735 [Fluviicola sp.]|nr:MAG: hypothetical protein COA32_15735 [Fluviicola sp.]